MYTRIYLSIVFLFKIIHTVKLYDVRSWSGFELENRVGKKVTFLKTFVMQFLRILDNENFFDLYRKLKVRSIKQVEKNSQTHIESSVPRSINR